MIADQRPKVLIASSERDVRDRLTETLRFRFQAVTVGDGWMALHLVNAESFAALVVTERLESLSGLDVAYTVREGGRNRAVPILLLAGRIDERIRAMVAGGVVDRCIDAGAETGVFLFEFNAMCAARAERAWDTLAPDVRRVLKTARHSYNAIFESESVREGIDPAWLSVTADAVVDAVKTGRITAVLTALQNHDDYTFVHSLSVAAVLAFFGRQIGIRDSDLGLMAQAGFAHDLGKRAIPHAVLYKPGFLEAAQMDLIRRHAMAGGEILMRSHGIPAEVMHVAMRHHEHMDGSGYPRGLKGAEIDDLSLVAAIADVFSAISDNRCYKPRNSATESLRSVRRMAGSHLESHHVAKFFEVMTDTGFAAALDAPLAQAAE